MMLRRLGKLEGMLGRLARGQRGSLLLEVLVAVALFGVLGSAVLVGVQGSSTSKRLFDDQATVENLLRNQMEHVLEQAYLPPGGCYPAIASPAGYSVAVDTLVYCETNMNIEKVRVTVLRDGQPVKALETLRTNR